MGRVIFVNRYFYPDHSATSQMLSDLAFCLAQKGMDVNVVSSGKAYQLRTGLGKSREAIGGVRIYRLWAPPVRGRGLASRTLEYLVFYVLSLARLLVLVKRGDTVVAMTDPPLVNVLVWGVAKLKGAFVIHWLQDIFPEVAAELGFRSARGGLGWVMTKTRDFVLSRSSACVVIGEIMRERLADNGIPDDKIKVIHNWAHCAEKCPSTFDVQELKEKWVGEGRFVVGYAGNLGRAHIYREIIDAAEILSDDADIVFLIVGGGVFYECLKKEVLERGLRNFVFKSYQPRERLSVMLRVPDLHLITLNPRLEGLIVPSKFYGIAAAGKASIFVGAEDGEIARAMRRYNCGVSIREGQSRGLAQLILALKADRTQLAEMGRNARNMYMSGYTLEASSKEWLEVLTNFSRVTACHGNRRV